MKQILVLANSANSGADWIHKHGHLHRDKYLHRWHTAYNTDTLEKILKDYFIHENTIHHIEIEGYILPDFQHNPQKALMIELIINHKRAISNASAEKFVTNVLIPNKESLL
jgi:hypothetical protein